MTASKITIENEHELLDEYEKHDIKFNTKMDISYENLVNFSQTKDKPIHRWFYYQEGYSPQLVINILNHLKINDRNNLIFDPCAGSGTTLLTAKQLGMKSIGFEINPFSAFMIKVKTRNYTENEMNILQKFQLPIYKSLNNVYKKYELRTISKLFEPEKLEKIELLKYKIKQTKNIKIRDLLMACLLSILEDVSNYRRGGNGLKKRKSKNNLDPFREFENKLHQVYEDLKIGKNGYEPNIINDSCLNLEKSKIKDIDVSIFSPPYANCFDPFEVYKIELWLGDFLSSYERLKEMRREALTSNLNANLSKNIDTTHRTPLFDKIHNLLSKKDLWDKRLVKMLDTYFYDIDLLLNALYKKTKKNGFCVIVVGNSAYGNIAIPVDLILAQLGERSGFKVSEIIVARRNETSSQQQKKLDGFISYMRESIVVLKK